MRKTTCIRTHRGKNGRIVGYTLRDNETKMIHQLNPSDVKERMRSNRIDVDNLTLTSDNRLVQKKQSDKDCAIEHLFEGQKPGYQNVKMQGNIQMPENCDPFSSIFGSVETFDKKDKHEEEAMYKPDPDEAYRERVYADVHKKLFPSIRGNARIDEAANYLQSQAGEALDNLLQESDETLEEVYSTENLKNETEETMLGMYESFLEEDEFAEIDATLNTMSLHRTKKRVAKSYLGLLYFTCAKYEIEPCQTCRIKNALNSILCGQSASFNEAYMYEAVCVFFEKLCAYLKIDGTITIM